MIIVSRKVEMKTLIVAVALCGLLAAPLGGQWLEKTILVPDSFVWQRGPQSLAYESAANTIYVGSQSGNCIIAIEGTTMEKFARIPADTGVRVLCYNLADNKLYAANHGSNSVHIIDCATNRVIDTVSVGVWPLDLCYNSVEAGPSPEPDLSI